MYNALTLWHVTFDRCENIDSCRPNIIIWRTSNSQQRQIQSILQIEDRILNGQKEQIIVYKYLVLR